MADQNTVLAHRERVKAIEVQSAAPFLNRYVTWLL